MNHKFFFIPLYLLLGTMPLTAAQEIHTIPNLPENSGHDQRLLVSMPEETRQLMRKEMLDHLSALNEIITYIAVNKLEAAATVAETRMGKSSMGKHRASGKGPGRFMPQEMRNIGRLMHESATELSLAAKAGNLQESYNALSKLTASCVACHYSFRTQ